MDSYFGDVKLACNKKILLIYLFLQSSDYAYFVDVAECWALALNLWPHHVRQINMIDCRLTFSEENYELHLLQVDCDGLGMQGGDVQRLQYGEWRIQYCRCEKEKKTETNMG